MSTTAAATPNYDDAIVKKFLVASLLFGVVGMLALGAYGCVVGNRAAVAVASRAGEDS